MTLLKSDLFRAFTVGFALGCAGLIAMLGSPFEKSIADTVIPAAVAAPNLPDQTVVPAATEASR